MMRLIGNELRKLFRTRKLYVFAAVMVVVLVLNLSGYKPGDPMVVWTFRHGQSVPLGMLDILAQFMIIFIPIYLGDSLANEYRRGTLKLPLLRPVRRSELLGAKLASLFVFIAIMTLFYIAAAYAVGTYYLGWGDGTEVAGRLVPSAEGIRLTLASAVLLAIPYMIYGLFVTAVAVLTGSMSVTIIGALVVTTLVRHLSLGWLESMAPYTLNDQMFSYHEAFIVDPDWNRALRQTGILALYAAVFALFAFRAFRKKDILH